MFGLARVEVDHGLVWVGEGIGGGEHHCAEIGDAVVVVEGLLETEGRVEAAVGGSGRVGSCG